MRVTGSFQHKDVLGMKFGYSPFGKPNLFVHVYFIDGLLIDTGQRIMGNEIAAATKELYVEQMFITHYHEDHTGNIPRLQQQHNCQVFAPRLTCEMMKDPPKLSFAQKVTYGQRGPYRGLIPAGETLETKNFQFQLLSIPGHAPDMVCMYEPNRKWLFSADLYINSYIGYFLMDESVKQQITSTQKILKLDFDVMFCAHNPQLTNAKFQLKKKLNFLEQFFEDVSKLHQQGNSANEIFKQLELKEDWFVRLLSGGHLSKLNMVKSVIRDIETDIEKK